MSKSKYLKKLSEDCRFDYYGVNDKITYAINKTSGVEYFINEEEGVVVCHMDNEYGEFRGKSEVSERDKFDLETGMKLARLRATLALKREILETQKYILNDNKKLVSLQERRIDTTYNRIKEIKEEIQKMTNE